ncbi:hypothetical protein ACIOHC_11065 [Streptomyces sp. NPDC088252]|uniref:hypothetical protein n=1 Tax=unclassified Streptomyces TaxID=2593676 RepID=UPI003825E0F6
MRDTTDQPRDGNGKYEYVNTAVQRDAAASLLKAEGKTYQEIADTLGYYDRGHAWRGVQRARTAILREPAEHLMQVEAERLDEQYVAALSILEREHVMVSHGKVVCDDMGQPILDDGPKLAALREMRQIRESYRRLHGLDSPAKVDVGGELKYEVVGIAPEDLA